MDQINLPIKIGIIDNEVDRRMLKTLVPYYSGNIAIIPCEKGEPEKTMLANKLQLPVNHSTLCTALLIEGLHKNNILDKVQITNISIANRFGENTFQGLMNALDYCNVYKFDILSLSVGVLSLPYAKRMVPLLQELRKTVVVSAAANDFSLTYPAAFSAVIGVKRAVYKTNQWIEVVDNPLDGVEIIMSYTKTSILHRLSKEYQLNYENSNSILVPQVCAEIANHIIKRKMEPSKKSVLKTFARLLGSNDINSIKNYLSNKELDDCVPIVLFQYESANQKDRYYLLKRLQETFERNGYSCAILCDFIDVSDFEHGWYRISSENIDQEKEYYLNVISDSIILLLLSDEIKVNFSYDISIGDKALSYPTNEQEIEKFYNKLVDILS